MDSLKPRERDYWEAYLQSAGLGPACGLPVTASMPGNPQIADNLVALYLAGRKTAGSGLVKDYEMAGDPLPEVGCHWIILDGRERPVCIARTTRVVVHPFMDVPEYVAIAEGEGDLSVSYWRDAHRRFFAPYLSRLQIQDLDTALIVTEFFTVITQFTR